MGYGGAGESQQGQASQEKQAGGKQGAKNGHGENFLNAG
jgi:hypothetical protein